MLTYRRIQVSQRQLRRALVRALRIMEKHKGAHPALSGLEAELVASAKNFSVLSGALRD
jgi:hypothetical protein